MPARRLIAIPLLVVALAGCRTVGIARKDGFSMVSPNIANTMILDSRQIVVIDFRNAEAFTAERGHIPGAMSVPLDTIEFRLAEILPYKESTVVVYGDLEGDGERGARILSAAGFRNIVVIDGGLEEWRSLGYRTTSAE